MSFPDQFSGAFVDVTGDVRLGVAESEASEILKPQYTTYQKKMMAKELQAIVLKKKKMALDCPVKTAVVDFHSPEIGEELDVGHFRSAIVADSVARLLKFSGVKVHLRNHIGAWSKKFCMLLQYFMAEYRNKPGELDERVFKNQKLQDLLRRSGRTFQADREFKKAAEALFWQYVDSNVLFIKAWPLVSEFCYQEFQNIYRRIGVTILDGQEDRVHLYFHAAIQTLKSFGLISERKDDQHIFLIDKNGHLGDDITNFMIEGFNHILTDLTALWYRLKVEKAEWIIYITIEQKRQKDHWDNVMKLAGTAGWLPTEGGSFKTLPKASHIGVGLVPGSDTVKAFKLFDLLDEAKSAARRHLMKCGDARGNKWDEDSLEKLAETIGCAAAKYVYLQDDRRGNDKSDFVRMLNDREINVYFPDHGSFCYTWRHYKEVENDDIVLDEDLECELGSHLLKFVETVMTACKSVKPSLLCGYLSRLIQIFKTFSDDLKARKVFVSRNRELWNRKTLLCEAASSIMRQCFDLLGVPDPFVLCSEEYVKSAGK